MASDSDLVISAFEIDTGWDERSFLLDLLKAQARRADIAEKRLAAVRAVLEPHWSVDHCQELPMGLLSALWEAAGGEFDED